MRWSYKKGIKNKILLIKKIKKFFDEALKKGCLDTKKRWSSH